MTPNTTCRDCHKKAVFGFQNAADPTKPPLCYCLDCALPALRRMGAKPEEIETVRQIVEQVKRSRCQQFSN